MHEVHHVHVHAEGKKVSEDKTPATAAGDTPMGADGGITPMSLGGGRSHDGTPANAQAAAAGVLPPPPRSRPSSKSAPGHAKDANGNGALATVDEAMEDADDYEDADEYGASGHANGGSSPSNGGSTTNHVKNIININVNSPRQQANFQMAQTNVFNQQQGGGSSSSSSSSSSTSKAGDVSNDPTAAAQEMIMKGLSMLGHDVAGNLGPEINAALSGIGGGSGQGKSAQSGNPHGQHKNMGGPGFDKTVGGQQFDKNAGQAGGGKGIVNTDGSGIVLDAES